MVIKIIDWVGRLTTAKDIVNYLLDRYNEIAEAEQKRLQQEIDACKAKGMSQKVAEATALWSNNLISDEGYHLILLMEKK